MSAHLIALDLTLMQIGDPHCEWSILIPIIQYRQTHKLHIHEPEGASRENRQRACGISCELFGLMSVTILRISVLG